MSDGAGSTPRRFASITRRHASIVAVSPRSLAASRTVQATSPAGLSWPVWSWLSSAIIIPWVELGNAQDGRQFLRTRSRFPSDLSGDGTSGLTNGCWAVLHRLGRSGGGSAGLRYLDLWPGWQ